ncbi:MAG TPA: acyl-ACP--UDP-N-acetylglucosamine O-acyltransferase [Saprospiraceae bacterium]|nr:acyl-ACP--UDP-N-acetylglucosamine O-acyltransferase [Saprospiraceae bacterium]HNG89851.1 acyl-ACP--UDP-N-acetylglucosamine O-acyltransferase [Saprospiraceae bacterium]
MDYTNGLRAIHPSAKIGKNVTIGPFTVIEEDVVIGDDCWIGPNVNIFNGTRIGHHCRIFPGAVISAIPQDLKYMGEKTTLEIGNHVTIRECCTLNRGTINEKVGADGRTSIGDHCLLMAYVHIAHDCHVGARCVLANNVTLAGHIDVGCHATLGGMVAVHQFVRIGDHAMVGGGSLVRKDVPPFVTAAREPLSYAGINTTGLSRRGFSREDMHLIEDVYRYLFVKGYSISKALAVIEQELPPSVYRDQIMEFVRGAKRGLMKGYRGK